jgi:hypothetical protein
MVQCASVTSPTESLQYLVLKWFVFDSQSNVIAPFYLEPELGADGDFINFLGILLLAYHGGTTRSLYPLVGCLEHWKQRWISRSLGRTRAEFPAQDTPSIPHPSSRDVPSLGKLDGAISRPIKLPSVAPCPSNVHGGYCNATAPRQSHGGWSTTTLPYHTNMGGSPAPYQVYQCHHPAMYQAPSASPRDVPSYVHVSASQSVTQCNPSSTSSSFSVIPDEGILSTMPDTGHPTSAMNRIVLTMTDLSVTQVPVPAPLTPATMLPPLNDTQGFPK